MNDETPQSRDDTNSPPDEAPAEPAGVDPGENPRPPFVRQVSNRVFPRGRRPETDDT
jgi:hypothetical protein